MNPILRLLAWLLLLSLAPLVANAAETTPLGSILGDEGDEFEYDDSGDKPWQEAIVGRIPPLPADDRLLPAEIDSLPRGMKLFIAPDSLSLGEKDQTLRFWVVITSAAGAYNATYEGVRCETGEFKVYAYGRRHASPAVRLAPRATWRDIGVLPGDHFRRELADDYLCEGPVPRKPDVIVDILAAPGMAEPTTDLSDD